MWLKIFSANQIAGLFKLQYSRNGYADIKHVRRHYRVTKHSKSQQID